MVLNRYSSWFIWSSLLKLHKFRRAWCYLFAIYNIFLVSSIKLEAPIMMVSNVGQGHADLCLPVQSIDRGGMWLSDHGSRTYHRLQSVYSLIDQFNLLKSLPIPIKHIQVNKRLESTSSRSGFQYKCLLPTLIILSDSSDSCVLPILVWLRWCRWW